MIQKKNYIPIFVEVDISILKSRNCQFSDNFEKSKICRFRIWNIDQIFRRMFHCYFIFICKVHKRSFPTSWTPPDSFRSPRPSYFPVGGASPCPNFAANMSAFYFFIIYCTVDAKRILFRGHKGDIARWARNDYKIQFKDQNLTKKRGNITRSPPISLFCNRAKLIF